MIDRMFALNLADLSTNATELLAALPCEPLAWPVPDLAEELLGQNDSKSLAIVKQALGELSELVYTCSENTAAHGRKDQYGIRRDRWRDVQSMFGIAPPPQPAAVEVASEVPAP